MGVNKFRRPVMAPGYLDADGNPIDGGGEPVVIDFETISAIEGDWRGEGVETLLAALTALQGS